MERSSSAATAYSGSVSGLTPGDTLDLASLAYGSNMTAGFSGNMAGGVLSVSNGAQTADITLFGNFMASAFTLEERQPRRNNRRRPDDDRRRAAACHESS